MAKEKKEKKSKEEKFEEESGGFVSVLKRILIAIVIFLVCMATIVLLIKFDVGGFGSLLKPIFSDTPVVKYILPKAKGESNKLEYNNLSDAIDRIHELEAQLQTDTGTGKDLAKEIDRLTKEVERLKVFEKNQTQFEKDKQDFYNEVVYNDKAPDPSEYEKWYSTISPENAETIYRQVVSEKVASEDLKNLATTYAKMKPSQAASILEAMSSDMQIVCSILDAMKPEEKAAILGAMDKDVAARITKYSYK